MDDEEGATLQQLQGHSIRYRIAMGAQVGRKVLTVQTIPAWQEDDYGSDQPGRAGGFSLHAGVSVNTRERKRLECICRYIFRPALSEARLELTEKGMVRYALKTASRFHGVLARGGLPSNSICFNIFWKKIRLSIYGDTE